MNTMDMTPHTMKRMGKKVKHMTVIIVPFRGHNASPVDSGVTATDFCKLLRNTGLHDDYSKDNEEDIQNTVSEGEKVSHLAKMKMRTRMTQMTTKMNLKSSKRMKYKRMNWRTIAMTKRMKMYECLL